MLWAELKNCQSWSLGASHAKTSELNMSRVGITGVTDVLFFEMAKVLKRFWTPSTCIPTKSEPPSSFSRSYSDVCENRIFWNCLRFHGLVKCSSVFELCRECPQRHPELVSLNCMSLISFMAGVCKYHMLFPAKVHTQVSQSHPRCEALTSKRQLSEIGGIRASGPL